MAMVIRFRKPCLLLCLLSPTFFLTACSNGDSSNYEEPADPKVRYLELTSVAPAAHQGDVIQVTAGVVDDDSDLYDYQWQQIDTTGVDALNPAGMDSREFSFTVPDVTQATTLRFSVVVSEDDVQIVRGEVALAAYPNPLLTDITITDAGLKDCLDSAITDNGWQLVSDVTELHCEAWQLSTLEGAEQLTALTLFNQPGTNDTESVDIEPLSKLPLLEEINFFNTDISSFDWLSDVSNAFPSLDIFRITGHELEDVEWITRFERLLVLEIDGGLITDLSPLVEYTTLLQTLSVGGKEEATEPLEITNLEQVAGLLNLTTLRVSHATISSIDFLEDMPNLEALSLENTDITDISVLAELENLTELELIDTDIDSLTALTDLTALESLTLTGSDDIACTEITALQQALPELLISGRPDC